MQPRNRHGIWYLTKNNKPAEPFGKGDQEGKAVLKLGRHTGDVVDGVLLFIIEENRMKSVRERMRIACTAFAFALALPLAFMGTASAQEITSSITGTVLGPDGSPVSSASASVTDNRDGRTVSAQADDRGIVTFRGLEAGGPYTVRIGGQGYNDLQITDLYTDVAGRSSFTVTLEAAGAQVEEIVVTAAQIEAITTASGPSATFSFEEINNLPSTQRQIRDVIRVDPRVSIGQTGDGGDQSGQISCLGGSSRTNSFTIDGVRATDPFGLNLSGNLARFTFPIPFDSVTAAAVEFSPVSVEYGQFSGCNVNVVTKSGSNEFHGGGFYLYNDDSLTGDKIDGNAFDQGTFERENYGLEIGGPIIKDKLFFYLAWEEFDTATVSAIGAADDTSFPRNDTVFTQAELDQISQILQTSYGRDPGALVRNLPVESERIFARFDWNITDQHRLEATYTSLEEITTIGDDIGSGRGEFTFSDNFHIRGSDSETLAVRLYSDWTDNLSTEIRFSQQEVIDLQNPLGGGEQQDATPKPRIALSPIFASEFAGTEFVSGPGTFRSANKLSTEKDQLKIKADYQAGDHLITVGYENESLDVFNLFIINATGTVFFGGGGSSSTDMINALAAGTAFEIISANSFTSDPNDAAAIFTRDINSAYIQDTWDLNDSMQLIFGVRHDWYESDDLPLPNANFQARYGLDNQVSFDGLEVTQPRIGFNWDMPAKYGDTRLSLGYGHFAGNDPTVWFSNAYQNFGGALGRASLSGSAGCTGAELNVLAGGSFSGIPDCVLDAAQAQAQATLGTVNATDKNLDLPTSKRFSIGIEHNTAFDSTFWSDWNTKVDLIWGDLENQVDFLDLTLQQSGTMPDGRPIYTTVDPLLPGCNATFNGLRQGWSNFDPALCTGGNNDILFTNKTGDNGDSFTLSLQASKRFEFGDSQTFDFTFGYSYNESNIANPGTSFTASGNFRSVVVEDVVGPVVGPSLRNSPQNFVLVGTWGADLWGDNRTSVTAFFQRREGHPISPVFGGSYAGQVGDPSGRQRHLLYVPDGPSDPLVNFGPGFDTDAFFRWVNRNDLKRGAIANKGTLDEPWFSDLDIRIQQEIPFFGDSKAKIFFDIENVLNLINDDWGAKRYINTTGVLSAVGVVDATVDPGGATYTYDQFNAPVVVPDTFDSLYRIQLGIRADF